MCVCVTRVTGCHCGQCQCSASAASAAAAVTVTVVTVYPDSARSTRGLKKATSSYHTGNWQFKFKKRERAFTGSLHCQDFKFKLEFEWFKQGRGLTRIDYWR